MAAAHFSLCLHVKSRHLGDAYRYPTKYQRDRHEDSYRYYADHLRHDTHAVPSND
ncbi:hypothetical protein [Rubripirellula obstinata]|uniref:hypothetical protein n=1 Tax=Rubripirellula obstinata TaxID=406547 RepID=UPI0013903B03|nr:hypothetical protein [Rubripirellula obstinata]